LRSFEKKGEEEKTLTGREILQRDFYHAWGKFTYTLVLSFVPSL
jgi:hypothetical protein